MGWNITLIENSLVVPLVKREAVAREMLLSCQDKYGAMSESVYDEDYCLTAPAHEVLALVFGGGHRPNDPPPQNILFDPDDMEHMDFVTHDDAICAYLAREGCSGRILFGSLEGDNKGSFWGVEIQAGHYRSMSADLKSLNWIAGTSRKG